MDASLINLNSYTPVNHLWARMVDRLGVENSQRAVRQAFDLQSMRGSNATLPVLFFETCGLALANAELLYQQAGFPFSGKKIVLLVSIREDSYQLLKES